MQAAPLLFWGILALIYLAFWLWYGGRGKPLSPDEIEIMLTEMRRRAGKQPGEETPLLEHFRELAKNGNK